MGKEPNRGRLWLNLRPKVFWLLRWWLLRNRHKSANLCFDWHEPGYCGRLCHGCPDDIVWTGLPSGRLEYPASSPGKWAGRMPCRDIDPSRKSWSPLYRSTHFRNSYVGTTSITWAKIVFPEFICCLLRHWWRRLAYPGEYFQIDKCHLALLTIIF